MNRNLKLATQVVAVAMVLTTSAFGESRHRGETRDGGSRDRGNSGSRGSQQSAQSRSSVEQGRDRVQRNVQRDIQQNRGANEAQQQRQQQQFDRRNGNDTRRYDNRQYNSNPTPDNGGSGYRRSDYRQYNDNRQYDNNRGNRSYDRNYDRNRNNNDGWRNDNRGYNNNRRYDNNSRYGNRTPYFTHGRVSRYERWNDGYRVWVGGALYPFFVPELYFRSHNWRVGIDIAIGGYYNPAGYYDYYDGPIGGQAYTSGTLRGVVESVDYRRGTMVLRDDISGNFVTTLMRGSDRTFGSLRPGDYVEISGDWTRNGLFDAYRADIIGGDDGYYRR